MALAVTAMPFAHSAEDEVERWLRAMRLHGTLGPDVLDRVPRRAGRLA